MKSTVEEIRQRFDADVERFSNLETGQSATVDAPLAMALVAEAAAATKPTVSAYLDRYIRLVRQRLSPLAQGTTVWWPESRPFFGGLQRERIWVFWRRVLHTCHHRTQVQTWLRFAGHEPVPAIYGPSGDVKWDESDPTYSLEAAKRGG
jgi:uncharacterized damage-inducible protein DinB